jgi:uncharacterized protein with GYD domain
MADGAAGPRHGAPQAGRRRAFWALVRSLCVSTALVVGYFVLPLDGLMGRAGLTLVLGLGSLVVLLVWEIRQIIASRFPQVRAVEALALIAALFFVAFSTTYYLMSREQPASFNEPLGKLDAGYFVVTVFATVGFGDIVARTETARAVVLVQMIADLVVLGLVARVLVRAVQVARDRQGTSP